MTHAQDWTAPDQPSPTPVPAEEPPEEPPEEEPRRRHRGRTVRLLGAALLVGVTAGTAVGYRIQADRPPTRLAPLSQPGLVHPAKPLPKGKEPDPLPASQDRAVRTAGDLRKLVVPRPAGARNPETVLGPGKSKPWYVQLGSMATWYDDEAYMFSEMSRGDIRRIATDEWESGKYRSVTVTLYQFRASDHAGAIDHADDQQEYMPGTEEGAGNEGFAVKGSGNARGYIFPAEREAGYMPLHRARAIGYKGDVFFDINMYDASPVPKDDLRKLAEQQVERL